MFASYGPESLVYERCAKNWLTYASYYPEVDFYLFGESASIPLGSVQQFNDHYRVGVLDLSETGYDHQYRQSYTWSKQASEKGNKKNKAIFDFMVNLKVDYHFFYQVNVTALVSLFKLQKITELFPRDDFYGGLPIFFKDRDRFYICGSNIIYSKDVFHKLCYRYASNDPSVDSLEYSSGDIWWSALLADHRITPLPMTNISFKDQGIKSDPMLLLDALRARLAEGHFQFRFKNEIDAERREYIDPRMHAYAIAAMLTQDNRSLQDTVNLIVDYGKTWHHNLTVVGSKL